MSSALDSTTLQYAAEIFFFVGEVNEGRTESKLFPSHYFVVLKS